jgi:alpha-1,3-mannosyltransferase
MKIVHVVRQFWPSGGGLEEFVERLAIEQVAAGAQIRVVTLNRVFTSRGAVLPQRDMRNGVEIVRVPFFGSARYPFAPAALAHLHDADVVHVHAVDFFFDFIALSLGLLRRPIVATTHGGFFHTSAFSALKRIWFNLVTRLNAKLYGAVIACSVSDYETFASISTRNLRLVENGVDIEKFGNAASPAPVKSLVTLGRFSLNKRLDRLLDMMEILVSYDREWRLDILGIESDWSADSLRREISKRGLDACVELHIGLERDAVAGMLRRSSLFVSASEYEGFGIALVEALSAGLLPVVHGNDAYRGFFSRHGGVRVTDFSDAVASAQAIQQAFADLAISPGMRSAAMEISARFAWPQVAESYFEIYREVVGRRSARSKRRDPERPQSRSLMRDDALQASVGLAERGKSTTVEF